MRIINKAIFVTFALILVLLLIAGPVLAAAYFGLLLVQETGGTAYTKLPVIFEVNNTYLVEQNYMDGTGLDTRVTSGGSELPRMITDNKTLVAVDLSANSNKTLNYTMGGGNLTASMPVITGYGGYLTVSDNTNIELGDNFTVLVDGWWFTDNFTDRNAVIKDDAFGLFISDETDITAAIPTTSTAIKYEVNDDAVSTGFLTSWNAQTFTTIGAILVHSVEIKVYEAGTPPAISVNITATAAGVPTSTVLVSKEVPASVTATWGAAPGDWQTVTFDGIIGTQLAPVTMYGITISTLGGDGANNILWRLDASAPAYGGGTRASSSDQGEIWTTDATRDLMFRINNFSGPRVTATSVASGEHEVVVENLHNMITNGSFENGNPPDNWVLGGAGASVNQDGVTFFTGSYSANLTRDGANCSIYNSISNFVGYRGEVIIFGVKVKTSAANSAFLTIWDGVSSNSGDFHSGSGDWEWITVTRTIDGGSTFLRGYVELINTNTTIYIDAATMVNSPVLPDGGSFSITVDDVLEDATFSDNTTEVPDNANNWLMMQNNVLSWADNITIDVDGVQQLYFAPVDIIAGTLLPDRAGGDNPGAFTWGSNPAGISVNFTSFSPVAEAKAPAFTLGEAPDFITATPNITSSFTIVPPTAGFPLAGVIAAVADATSTPPQLPLLIIGGFVILAASFATSAIFRKHGSGTIFVKILVIAAFMGIFIALANFGIDFWMLVVFLIIAVAMAIASKQLGWT